LFFGILVAMIPLLYQWSSGMLTMERLRTNAWGIFWPYVCILGAFIVANIGRTLVLSDRERLRSKRRVERRAEHQIEGAKYAEAKAQAKPKPNLVISRVEVLPASKDDYHINSLAGYGDLALFATITNQISGAQPVGYVEDVNATIQYFNTNSELLERVTRACWEGDTNAHFGIDDSRHLTVLFREKHNDYYSALDKSHVRILARRVPVEPLDICISLSSPKPVYTKRFHLIWNGKKEGVICSGTSCAFCQHFVLQGG